MGSIALANELKGLTDMVVAVGYYTHPKTVPLIMKLKGFIAKKNICQDVSGMVTVLVPPEKRQKILERFPEIKERKKFFGCTHTWEDKGYEDRFRVEWHPTNVRNNGAPK